MRTKVSIAMATYNGAKHLKEQLNSFSSQTLLPNELVVCDDGSADETVQILKEFSQSAPFKVKIYQNKNRLGYANNFNRAMSFCEGHIVFLSDQDDYWLPSKIELVCEAFDKDPTAWIIINDAFITNEYLGKTGLTILGQINSTGLSTDHHNNGCCTAYRQIFTPVLIPIPAPVFTHDNWIHQLGLTLKCRKVLPLALQCYRRHNQNTSSYVTSRTSRSSPLTLLRYSFKLSNIRRDPIQACDMRLHQFAVFKERLEQQKIYLQKNLPLPDAWADSVKYADLVIQANESRKAILIKPLPVRTLAATRFFLVGGYKAFEGFRSLMKDLLR